MSKYSDARAPFRATAEEIRNEEGDQDDAVADVIESAGAILIGIWKALDKIADAIDTQLTVNVRSRD